MSRVLVRDEHHRDSRRFASFRATRRVAWTRIWAPYCSTWRDGGGARNLQRGSHHRHPDRCGFGIGDQTAVERQLGTRWPSIGTGAQARAHLESIPLARPIAAIGIAGRSNERAERFSPAVAHLRPAFGSKPRLRSEEAVRGADIVVTATSAREPILERDWVAAGTHINAVVATSRELDGASVAACSLFVDRRESTIHGCAQHRSQCCSAPSATDVDGRLGASSRI
jgi:hypothetical protein